MEDRLTTVTTPDGTTWRYLYDPHGRRIAKQRLTADSSKVVEQTDFTWDGSTLTEQTAHTPGTQKTISLTWDHRGLTPLTQTERKTTALPLLSASQQVIDQRFFTIVTDLVGTPTELVSDSGGVAWRTRSTLWGTTTWNSDATAYTPLRFPGQYFDPEAQLHYNFQRYYDPETARYVTDDPLGLDPSSNSVTYVDNPHAWVDPLGLMSCEPKLSDPLPQGLPKAHVHAYEEIRAGRGDPQIDPRTGEQAIFQGRGAHERPWRGAREWRVPLWTKNNEARILEKTLPDGRKVMGWTTDHYRKIHPFAAPHFPDSGWN